MNFISIGELFNEIMNKKFDMYTIHPIFYKLFNNHINKILYYGTQISLTSYDDTINWFKFNIQVDTTTRITSAIIEISLCKSGIQKNIYMMTFNGKTNIFHSFNELSLEFHSRNIENNIPHQGLDIGFIKSIKGSIISLNWNVKARRHVMMEILPRSASIKIINIEDCACLVTVLGVLMIQKVTEKFVIRYNACSQMRSITFPMGIISTENLTLFKKIKNHYAKIANPTKTPSKMSS